MSLTSTDVNSYVPGSQPTIDAGMREYVRRELLKLSTTIAQLLDALATAEAAGGSSPLPGATWDDFNP